MLIESNKVVEKLQELLAIYGSDPSSDFYNGGLEAVDLILDFITNQKGEDK